MARFAGEDTNQGQPRASAILSSLLSWAARQKLRTGNPCEGIRRYREQPVNRYPTPMQLAQIVSAVDELNLVDRSCTMRLS